MTTAFTSLLGFALPVTGELSGTWGDEVNNSITQLVEDSVAGVASTSVASGNWTLSTTGSGAQNQARMAILIPTGSPGVSRNIIAPGSSKAYIVINQSDAAVVLKASATTGVTIPASSTFLCAWNGSDFVKVSENVAGSNTQIQFNNNGVFGAAAGLTWDGTNLTANSIKDSALTAGRVLFAGASGLLSDSNNFTWDGTTLTITGAVAVSANSTFSSTGALTISKGTTLQRPGTAVAGMLRFNTTTSEFEGYNGTAWASVGGSAISNDTTTATDLYPTFVDATSGTALDIYTSNAKLLYKPSTGELKAIAHVNTNGIAVSADTVSSDYTIATGTNGFSVGPITVNSGVAVTVASGQRWVII